MADLVFESSFGTFGLTREMSLGKSLNKWIWDNIQGNSNPEFLWTTDQKRPEIYVAGSIIDGIKSNG